MVLHPSDHQKASAPCTRSQPTIPTTSGLLPTARARLTRELPGGPVLCGSVCSTCPPSVLRCRCQGTVDVVFHGDPQVLRHEGKCSRITSFRYFFLEGVATTNSRHEIVILIKNVYQFCRFYIIEQAFLTSEL